MTKHQWVGVLGENTNTPYSDVEKKNGNVGRKDGEAVEKKKKKKKKKS